MPARDYRHWPITEAVRRVLLRLIFGKRTYEYLIRTLSWDPRIKTARMVDIVVRKDGMERRVEADWLKRLSIICWPHIKREQARREAERANEPDTFQPSEAHYKKLMDALEGNKDA